MGVPLSVDICKVGKVSESVDKTREDSGQVRRGMRMSVIEERERRKKEDEVI